MHDAPPVRDERWAFELLERVVKRRKAGQAFVKVVNDARDMFLDEKAVKAGAEHGRYYSKFALMLRASLRNDVRVISTIHLAWTALLRAWRNTSEFSAGTTWLGLGLSDDPSISKRGGFGAAAYRTMIRKLYLVLKLEAGDTHIDPQECLETIREDWPRDSNGGKELSEASFFNSWFELADLHTADVHRKEYVEFVNRMVRQITASGQASANSRGGGMGGAKAADDPKCLGFRTDAELLDSLCRRVVLPSAARHATSASPDAPNPLALDGEDLAYAQAAEGEGGHSGSHSGGQGRRDVFTGRAARRRIFHPYRQAWEAAFVSEERAVELQQGVGRERGFGPKKGGNHPSRSTNGRDAWLARPTAAVLLGKHPYPAHVYVPVSAHRKAPSLMSRRVAPGLAPGITTPVGAPVGAAVGAAMAASLGSLAASHSAGCGCCGLSSGPCSSPPAHRPSPQALHQPTHHHRRAPAWGHSGCSRRPAPGGWKPPSPSPAGNALQMRRSCSAAACSRAVWSSADRAIATAPEVPTHARSAIKLGNTILLNFPCSPL